MAKHYTIQLLDGRQLSISAQIAQSYPTIQNIIQDLADAYTPILLPYPDSEALYTFLTTNYLQQSYQLDVYLRLIKVIDFLGNDELLNEMTSVARHMIELPQPPNTDKNAIKSLVLALPPTILDRFYSGQIVISRPFGAGIELKDLTDFDAIFPIDIIFNDNLSYVAQTQTHLLQYLPETQEIVLYKQNADSFSTKTFISTSRFIIKGIDAVGNIYGMQDANIVRLISPDYQNLQIIRNIPNNPLIIFSLDLKHYYTFDKNTLKMNIMNMGDGQVLIQQQFPSLPDPNMTLFPSPRLAAVVYQSPEDMRTGSYTIYSLDRKPLTITDGISRISKNWYDGDYILFSYNEEMFAEVSRNISDDYEYTYDVRVLNRDGQILASGKNMPYQPIAIGVSYILTFDNTNELLIKPHLFIWFINNSQLVGGQEISLQNTDTHSNWFIEPFVEGYESPSMGGIYEHVFLEDIISGPDDSYLFVYHRPGPYSNDKEVLIEKYQLSQKTVADYLDEVLS